MFSHLDLIGNDWDISSDGYPTCRMNHTSKRNKQTHRICLVKRVLRLSPTNFSNSLLALDTPLAVELSVLLWYLLLISSGSTIPSYSIPDTRRNDREFVYDIGKQNGIKQKYTYTNLD